MRPRESGTPDLRDGSCVSQRPEGHQSREVPGMSPGRTPHRCPVTARSWRCRITEERHALVICRDRCIADAEDQPAGEFQDRPGAILAH